MATRDVNVYLINFPVPGRELVTENEDGSYTILINARLSDKGRLQAYEHALRHIEAGDFEGGSVQEIEARAHGLAPSSTVSCAAFSGTPEKKRRRRRKKKSRWAAYDRERREFLEQFHLPDPRPGLWEEEPENSMILDKK